MWEQNLNASLYTIDNHNHSLGNGVQIPPSGLNINASLPFNNQSATAVQSVVFKPQASLATLYGIYSIGADLYFNDGNGNVVQITSGGTVNATSSGISSGTNTASFVSNVLVVNSNTNHPANIQAASILLGNNSTGSKYLTLSPPSAMGSNIQQTLPTIPAQTNIMTMDSSGNMAASTNVDGSTLSFSGSTLAVASQGITATQIANSTITGTQIANNVNLSGTSVQVGSQNIVSSGANATTGLKIVRGSISGTGAIVAGEGFTVNHTANGTNSITFTTAFSDAPVVTVSTNNPAGGVGLITPQTSSAGTTGVTIFTYNNSNVLVNEGSSFIAIGQR